MTYSNAQRGYVLMTVLVVQLMIAIIAIAAMKTATLGERQSGASRHAHSAYNAAEQTLLSGIRCLQSAHDTGLSLSALMADCSGQNMTIDLQGSGSVRFLANGETPSGARRTLSLTATPPFPDGFFEADGAYSCFGPSCQIEAKSTGASPGLDGTDRMLPGHAEGTDPTLEDGCDNKGNSRPGENPDGENKAGAIVPEGDIEGGGFEGDPPTVDSGEDYKNLYGEDGELDSEALERAESDLNERIDVLASSFEHTDGDVEVSDGEQGVWVVGDDHTLSLDGKAFGGTVILDGGTLELGGNECFAGMVASRNGGQIDTGGTSAIVGGVLQIGGFTDEPPIIDAKGGGNASMFYSSSTLEWAKDMAKEISGGDRWSVSGFQQVRD